MRRLLIGLAWGLLFPVLAFAVVEFPSSFGPVGGSVAMCWNGSAAVVCVSPPLGGTGSDFSANTLAVPLPGYVLIATLPATPSRAAWWIYNLSGAQVEYVLDDGQGTSGTVSVLLLAGGAGAPSQGGSDGNQSFKGRVRVYAPSASAVVTVRQE